MIDPVPPTIVEATPVMLVLADSFPNVSESFIDDHVRLMAAIGWTVRLLVRQRNPGADEAAAALGENVSIATLASASPRTAWNAACWVARHPWSWTNTFAWRCSLHGARISMSAEASRHWDLVHAHYGNNAVSALIAKPRWHGRLLANFHGHDATSVPTRHGWTAYRRILMDAHAVAHSAFVERRLVQGTPMRVHRVTMGVDFHRFAPSVRSSRWSKHLKALSIGRLTRQKGHAEAIRAVRCLQLDRPDLDLQLTIVGDGPERAKLQSMIDELPHPERVELLGSMPHMELPALYARHDVMLLVSQPTPDGQQEAFGRVAIEAMACGLPVIACRIGGLPDTIGGGGIITGGFDPSSIAKAMISILERHTPDAWCALARRQAAGFSIQAMASDYAAITDLVAREAVGLQ